MVCFSALRVNFISFQLNRKKRYHHQHKALVKTKGKLYLPTPPPELRVRHAVWAKTPQALHSDLAKRQRRHKLNKQTQHTDNLRRQTDVFSET